MKQES